LMLVGKRRFRRIQIQSDEPVPAFEHLAGQAKEKSRYACWAAAACP
jgi:hypothetical protein